MKKTRPKSQGKCNFCHATFSKAAMTRHLQSCEQRRVGSETPQGKRGAKKSKVFHLVVEGRDRPGYWMHLDVRADATLADLDSFLRDIWLECCGHLSAFTIDGDSYTVDTVEGFDIDGFGDEGMDIMLGDVLRPGMEFSHEYDFGTTTELALKVVSEREGGMQSEPIQILARNDPQVINCELCGKAATQVCTQCIYEGAGWLCDKCASKHECGEEMLLPVVNSPRVGMCGYTG